jgi:methylisocitrate lyase
MAAITRSPGLIFRNLINNTRTAPGALLHRPVQLLGTANAYSALLAEKAGAQALYLSGAGVATVSYGLPDLAITTLDNVLEDVRRITSVTQLPLLVDVDTGFGGAFNIARTVREMERAGAAAIHIEDQVSSKRCGHRPNKQVVSKQEMVDRLKAAVDARTDPNFVIVARTDALDVEGMDSALDRIKAYVAAGADMIFPEAFSKLEQYRLLHSVIKDVPFLANITEFGKTELFSKEELGANGVSMVLYPLSAFRAMARAAETVYRSILQDGHQRRVIPLMQTRAELYQVINYHKFEDTLDRLYGKDTSDADAQKGQAKSQRSGPQAKL